MRSTIQLSMKPLIRLVVLALALAIAWSQSNKTGKTDDEVRQAIIQESIARYRGTVPVLTAGIALAESAAGEARAASPVELRRCVIRKM